MFLDCLELIFSSLEDVVSALDVDIFTVGTVGVSFWELILGLLVLGIIFGFFLTPRMGSGLAGIGNLNEHRNAQRENARRNSEKLARESERQARELQRQKDATYRESYEYYQNNRSRNEWYSRKYNAERGRSKE